MFTDFLTDEELLFETRHTLDIVEEIDHEIGDQELCLGAEGRHTRDSDCEDDVIRSTAHGSTSDASLPSPPKRKKDESLSTEKRKKILDYMAQHPNHGKKTICTRFRINEWVYEYVVERKQQGLSLEDKASLLQTSVYNMFKYTRDELLQTISDSDLQRMAWQVAGDTGYEGFKASDTWLLNYKQHYNIGPWKFTVFNTTVQHEHQPHILETVADHVSGIQQMLPTFEYKYVCNADQSGF